ncbi:hypothetical protein HMPREF9062_0472 [Actinomyces sp. oral taxon 448 str. F0400]|nr:hypothetical protein HMPREF9062_0472 [Actinomyces sp. oral taxon 448 str. F0400]
MTPGTPSPDGRTPGEAGAEAESAPGGPALREVGPPPPTRPAAPDTRSAADGSEPGDAGPAAAAPAGPGLAAAVRSILAALSCGALLAGAVVLTLACLWHSALPLSVGAGILRSLGARLIGILALWVVGVAILGRAPAGERARRSCAAGLIAAEICLTWCAVAAPRALWYELLATTTIPARHVLALAAAGACLGTAAIIDLLRRASAARPARGLRPARRAARRWRTILVVAFIDCLVCVLTAVLVVDGVVGLARAPRPDISTTTAAPLTLPARPEAVSGRTVWQRTASPEDLVVGAAGPILVEAGALRALDPADGSVLWSYERPGAELAPFSSTTGLLQNTGARAIVSPDGRHVAIHITTEKSSLAHSDAAVIIVLDAVTGAVTARIASEALTPFQLTDAMGFDGTRAFALNGGRSYGPSPNLRTGSSCTRERLDMRHSSRRSPPRSSRARFHSSPSPSSTTGAAGIPSPSPMCSRTRSRDGSPSPTTGSPDSPRTTRPEPCRTPGPCSTRRRRARSPHPSSSTGGPRRSASTTSSPTRSSPWTSGPAREPMQEPRPPPATCASWGRAARMR